MFETMKRAYEAHSATNHYVFGYVYRGVVYAAFVDGIQGFCKPDHASTKNGGGMCLRYAPKAKLLHTFPHVQVCMQADIENEYKARQLTDKHNRGDIFEEKLCGMSGIPYTKDHVPFDVDGDITLAGIPYQVKYLRACFTTETIMRNKGYIA